MRHRCRTPSPVNRPPPGSDQWKPPLWRFNLDANLDKNFTITYEQGEGERRKIQPQRLSVDWQPLNTRSVNGVYASPAWLTTWVPRGAVPTSSAKQPGHLPVLQHVCRQPLQPGAAPSVWVSSLTSDHTITQMPFSLHRPLVVASPLGAKNGGCRHAWRNRSVPQINRRSRMCQPPVRDLTEQHSRRLKPALLTSRHQSGLMKFPKEVA